MSDVFRYRLERDHLSGLAKDLGPAFAAAEPFPHVVIPNFLPPNVAAALAAEFPGPTDIPWSMAGPGEGPQTRDPNIEKLQCDEEAFFPPLIRHVMHELNSSAFLDFLMALTGYAELLSDPWFGGCGSHSTGRGGRLMIHADQDRHPNAKLHQILNAIYYVTPGWREEWGGALELWSRDASDCVKQVVPTFNSLVMT